MTVLFANNAGSTLAGAISNTATTANLATGTGVLFPAPTSGQYFVGTFNDAATGLLTEIIHVTNVTSDTITMVRAQESTTALNWSAGDLFNNLLTAGTMGALAQATQLQLWCGTSSGSGNAQTVSPAPALSAYTAGQTISFIAGYSNTGATTINVSSLGAKNIYKQTSSGPSALTGGEIVTNNIVFLEYDGTEFQLTYTTTANVANSNLNAWGGTAGGTANAITATTSPTLSAYSAGQLVSFIANATNTGATTVNLDSLGAKNIYKRSLSGPVALVGGEIVSGNIVVLEYDGTEFQLITDNGLAASPVTGARKNFSAANNSGTPNTEVTITADELILSDSNGNTIKVTSVNVTINYSASGANGLDTGSLAPSTGYYAWIISNGTTVAGLASLSSSSPTLPSGYTFKAVVYWNITDSSSNLKRIHQVGYNAWYVVTTSTNTAALPAAATGTAGSTSTPTWVGTSLVGLVPSIATRCRLLVAMNSSSAGQGVIVAPNSSYGPGQSTTNPTPGNLYPGSGANNFSTLMELILESTSVYYASAGANNGLFVYGWSFD